MTTASQRLKIADDAVRLCQKVKHYNPEVNLRSKEEMQAQAILTLAKLDRADMTYFRGLLGMTIRDFSLCLATARSIIRTGKVAIRSADPSPVMTWIIKMASQEVAA